MRGYGATAARVTPDHKVGSSNLSGLIVQFRVHRQSGIVQLHCVVEFAPRLRECACHLDKLRGTAPRDAMPGVCGRAP